MTELRRELNGNIAYCFHEIADIDAEISALEREREKVKRELIRNKNELYKIEHNDETVLADYAEYMRTDVQIDDDPEFVEHMKQKYRHEIRRERKLRLRKGVIISA